MPYFDKTLKKPHTDTQACSHGTFNRIEIWKFEAKRPAIYSNQKPDCSQNWILSMKIAFMIPVKKISLTNGQICTAKPMKYVISILNWINTLHLAH